METTPETNFELAASNIFGGISFFHFRKSASKNPKVFLLWGTLERVEVDPMNRRGDGMVK
jgi:hypothetical protein